MTRKKQILQTAAQLFRERGYSAVTMRDLAAAMDIKAASLYNHISGKQEILALLILEVAHEFTKGMETVKLDDVSAFAKAEQLILLHIKIALKHTNALAIMNTDWMHLEGAPYMEYKSLRKNYELDFKNILLEGMEKGEFATGNLDTMLFTLLSTLRSIYLWIPKKAPEDIKTLQTELPQLLLYGIRAV
jgi:AcrR family transcriptional regulator